MGLLALKWIKDNWRLVAGIAAIIFLAWSIHHISEWRDAYTMLPKVIKQSNAQLQQAQDRYNALNDAYETSLAASKGYQDELSKLQQTIDSAPSAPIIRVCKPAKVPAPSKGADPAGPGDAAASPGVLSAALEFDTGPLYGDADRCDKLSAQVRGLQQLAQ